MDRSPTCFRATILAVRALNRGVPIVHENNKSPLAAAFQDYARQLAGKAEKSKAPAPAKAPAVGGLLGRLTGRKA